MDGTARRERPLQPDEPCRRGKASHSPFAELDSSVDRLLGQLPAAQTEPIRRFVNDLLGRVSELEAEVRQQRTALQQLESYRDRYVDLYDFAPLGYATLDDEGYVQEINLAGAWLLASERAALVGYSFVEYVVATDRTAFRDHLRRCCHERREATCELSLLAKDGRRIAVQFHSVPMPAREDEGVFCKTAITDLTAAKQAQAAIQEERNLLRTLIDSVPDYVYVKDTQGRFLVANRPAARIVGAASPNDLVGKTDFDFYPADRAAEYHADEQRLLRTGQPLIDKDEPHCDPSGAPRMVLTTKLPLRDSAGQVIGLVGISRDVTERTRVEQSVYHLNDQLQAAYRELEAFTSSVCHDLRSPLQAIGGFSQLLAEEYAAELDEVGREYVTHIDAGVGHMEELINDLLELSRVTKAEIRRTAVDISALARAIAAELRHGHPERHVAFAVQDGVMVSGDGHLLRAVLENLLGNAWKYTSKHDTARIEFGVTAQDGEPVYFIRDDGAGFDMRRVDKLFDPFQRLHAADEFDGTGIGLSTVQRIIRAHGGRIWAEAAIERGATFLFTIPPPAAERTLPLSGPATTPSD